MEFPGGTKKTKDCPIQGDRYGGQDFKPSPPGHDIGVLTT